MTATDPDRNVGGAPEQQERRQADPWGVKRAENLLTSLQGVLSARVVVSPIGEVEEVHILTQGGTPAKQVVRNVESALLAHLGLKIDHRKISVAQTAEVKPIEALEQSVIKSEALRRGVLFAGIDFQSAKGRRVAVTVSLRAGSQDLGAVEEVADNPKARMQGAARAAVQALDGATEDLVLELEGVQLVQAFERTFAFCAVWIVGDRESHLLTGTCELSDSSELAAVLAVLDATNRWLASRF